MNLIEFVPLLVTILLGIIIACSMRGDCKFDNCC